MAAINPNGGVSAPGPAPVAVGGQVQPVSPHGPRMPQPKVIKVKAGKAHTRVVRPKVTAPAAVDPYAAAVSNAVDLKYGPQLQAVDQNINNAKYAQIRAGNWYQDYQNTLAQQQQRTAQQAQALAGALTQYNPQAAQTGNPQADALAQQAQQSQHYLGQAFAGQQGQLSQNVANEFATGLIPGAALQNQTVQQNLGNTISNLTNQRGQLKSQAGEYGVQVKGQLQAADQKQANDQQKNNLAAQALGLKVSTLNNVQIPLANSLMTNRVAGQKTARAKVRQTQQQDKVNNALKVNNLALKTFLAAHPELKGKGGQTVGQKYQQGVDRGSAILRLLHGTPPSKDPTTGAVTKPNPFYNLNPGQLRAHRQDLIDMLQASSKAGHLTQDQATRAVNAFLKGQGKNGGGDLGSIVTGILHRLSK